MKRIQTKFAVAKKVGLAEDAVYRSPRIYLPTKLTDDSSFPFKEGDLVSVKVDGRRLVVQKVRKSASDDTDDKSRKSHNTLERRLAR